MQDTSLTFKTKGEAKSDTDSDGIFMLYANLLSIEQQGTWETILEQKVNVAGWTHLCTCKQNKAHGKTYKHFQNVSRST